MAGDWIKWSKGLTRKMEVMQIAARLHIAPAHAAGALMQLMEWLDENVSAFDESGNARVTLGALQANALDVTLGVSGFVEAMAEVGWMKLENDSLIFIHAERHNGKTAKARALTKDRVAKTRNDSVTLAPLQKRYQRREEKSINTMAPAAKPAERLRDVLFDSMAIAEGSDPNKVTKSAGGRIGQALAQIKAVEPNLQPSDIQERAKAYKRLHPTWELTATALAAHWAKLDNGGRPVEQPETEPDDWKAYWRDTYPPEDYPNAERYENGTWWDVPAATRRQIRDGLRKRGCAA